MKKGEDSDPDVRCQWLKFILGLSSKIKPLDVTSGPSRQLAVQGGGVIFTHLLGHILANPNENIENKALVVKILTLHAQGGDEFTSHWASAGILDSLHTAMISSGVVRHGSSSKPLNVKEVFDAILETGSSDLLNLVQSTTRISSLISSFGYESKLKPRSINDILTQLKDFEEKAGSNLKLIYFLFFQ